MRILRLSFDLSLICQDCQSGSIGQSSQGGPGIKVVSFHDMHSENSYVCCFSFVVGHCLSLVVVCRLSFIVVVCLLSLFVVCHCLSFDDVCHLLSFVVCHC